MSVVPVVVYLQEENDSGEDDECAGRSRQAIANLNIAKIRDTNGSPRTSVIRLAVTPKCLGGPPVDRDQRNAHPGARPMASFRLNELKVCLWY
ncbi:hypothetical protein TNCV_1045891 [Trichonephila clavipes]|nr:hypothetical protein TNCV_1045891 [Trichonephila clavipes]